ncbi:MAG: flagellar basal-body rod protein FlgF [Thermoanaerobacteraceae bacterium]|nr:flagellar basal-body rod protein FlgF [Thermoanaerobacteraceae bacterium]
MLRGIYISAGSMVNQERKLDIVSNNLANADTKAFKKDLMIEEAIEEKQIMKVAEDTVPIGSMYFGVRPAMVYTDFKAANLVETGNPLDLSIKGDGFFEVLTQNGIRYTRDGSFKRDTDGYLVTGEGYRVQGANGDIYLNEGKTTFNTQGDIFVNGQYVDTLQIVDFPDKSVLRKEGDNLFATQGQGSLVANPEIASGFLETSNVNPIAEMVDMIDLMRIYEANQRVITTMDSTLDKAVNDLGRV